MTYSKRSFIEKKRTVKKKVPHNYSCTPTDRATSIWSHYCTDTNLDITEKEEEKVRENVEGEKGGVGGVDEE